MYYCKCVVDIQIKYLIILWYFSYVFEKHVKLLISDGKDELDFYRFQKSVKFETDIGKATWKIFNQGNIFTSSGFWVNKSVFKSLNCSPLSSGIIPLWKVHHFNSHSLYFLLLIFHCLLKTYEDILSFFLWI